MGFFTAGNIITLGIVILILVLYRQMDRNNRTLKLIRDYSERLKKELGDFVKDQERTVKDYAISLNVERDSAKELMKRLQETEEELAQKAQAMTRIDSQIKAYESSLAELESMTSRVQENMNRVRDESAFVDATGKRISAVKDKLAEFEKELVTIEKKYEKVLDDIERKFEKDNAESLEKTADAVMAGVNSTVSDLRAAEETIERQVEEHRQAVIKIEEARAANLARDTEYVNKLLEKAVEQAGKRADKMEEAALGKLKEQAEDRIQKLKTAEEERLRTYQESAKARVLEVQALVKSIKDEWRTERSDWESKDKAVRDERKKDLEIFAASFDASKKQIEDFSARVNGIVSSQETMLLKAAEEAKQALVKNIREEWRTERSEWEAMDKAARDERKKDLETFAASFDAFKKQIEDFSAHVNEIISSQEALLVKEAEEMKQTLVANLREEWHTERSGWEAKDKAVRDERKKDLEALAATLDASKKQIEDYSAHVNEIISFQKALLVKEAEEMKQALVANLREEWRSERSDWEAKDSALREERKKDLETFAAALDASKKQIEDYSARVNEIIGSQEALLVKEAEQMKQTLVTNIREEWRTERSDWEAKDKAVRDERKKDLETFALALDASKKQIEDYSARVNEIISSQKALLVKEAEQMKQTLVTNIREEWRTERSDWEAKDNAARDERKKDLETFAAMLDASKKQIEDYSARVNEIISSQETLLLKESEKMKQTLVTKIREEWHTERSDWEAKDSAARNERKKDLETFALALDASKKQIEDYSARVNEIISSQEALLVKESEEMKQTLVTKIREEWHTERSDWEAKDNAVRDAREKDLETFAAMLDASKKQIEEFSLRINEIVSSQEALLVKAAEEMKQKALEVNDVKLEEYRRAQDLEFRRLETLADDSRKLDAELRNYMQELIGRLKDEFSVYQRDAEGLRKAETENFSLTSAHLKGEMTEIEKGLAALKAAASENISNELKSFENDFFADLTKRGNEIDMHIMEWQSSLEGRLSRIGENTETALREMEQEQAEEMKKNLSAMDLRLVLELERLKSKASAFEEGILDQMKAADDSVSSFKEQLDRGLEDTRKEAEISIKYEIGNYSLTAAETVKKYQRELDDAWNELSAKLKGLDENVEDAHRRIRDLAAETDNRIASVRSSVEDAERHIREAKEQTKLIDVANAMKLEMERRIEDLKGDIDRLDQRRAEAAKLENEFIKIKRHEDDINAKMIKIFSEERRIENMEANFNRFLQISRSVEEKLADVSASNDTLLGVQLQIRKLEEALGATEEKFQRLERKNQILDNTNDGIDRNFKVLQETEKLSDKIGGELVQYADELERMRISIEKLSSESDKAASAVDRIDVLNDALEEIEERIKSMQRARQWIAEAETRLEELNRAAQAQVRATDSLVKGKKSGNTTGVGDGTLSEQKKRDIIILKEQGWTDEEIAKAEKISIGMVQLVLDMAPRERD